ncbi:MAG: flavodoxin family protein [Thermoplasmata archaeon]|nr:flavodoxin family protein [Thermoplasmata archaeon]
MYAIGISGSPRANGNTGFLLKYTLDAVECEERKIIFIGDKEIQPCDGCNKCLVEGKCIKEDAMQEIYPELRKADVIIIGTPTYFAGVTAKLKALIDRTYLLYNNQELKDKVGAAVVVMEGEAGDLVVSALATFFAQHQMVYAGGVVGTGSRDKEVKRDLRAVRNAIALGKRATELARLIRAQK